MPALTANAVAKLKKGNNFARGSCHSGKPNFHDGKSNKTQTHVAYHAARCSHGHGLRDLT